MKALMKASGPRDMSIVEVTLKISNIIFQYRRDLQVFRDPEEDFETRQSALVRLGRGREMLESWGKVRESILSKKEKGGGVPRGEIRVS